MTSPYFAGDEVDGIFWTLAIRIILDNMLVREFHSVFIFCGHFRLTSRNHTDPGGPGWFYPAYDWPPNVETMAILKCFLTPGTRIV